MFLAVTQVVFFLMKTRHPTKYYFLFSLMVLTLEDALYRVLQMISYKVMRWLNHLLAIGPQGVFL
jgi:hypothetical protein